MPAARHLLSTLVFCCFAATALAQGPARRTPDVADWRHDLEAIAADIRLMHPEPFARVGRLTFQRELEAFEAALPSLNEPQRVVRAMRLVASVGDGHTQLALADSAFGEWYPFRLYEFSDGVFVTCAHRSVGDLAGARVIEIAGHPVAEVLENARSLMGADNAWDRRERLYAVHNAGLMKGLGYAAASGALIVRVQLKNGRIETRTLRPTFANHPSYARGDSGFEWQYRSEVFGMPFGTDETWVSAYRNLPSSAFAAVDTTRPLHLMDRRPYSAHAVPERDAYYIRISQESDTDLVPFVRQALTEVDRLKPRRLIIDLRYNFGGDGSRLTQMIELFIKRADAPPWKELYLLTGRRTFSAGIMVIDQFLDHTQVTLVGEPAGGPINHFGDAEARPYPRTGLELHVSTLRHQLGSSDDVSDVIPVDVPATFSFADWAAGRDPAIDPILRGEEMRSLSIIAATDGGAAARRVYTQRHARFSGASGWSPGDEIALRNVGAALREQKRFDDAIETCRLNTEIYPYSWHTWLNLGFALRAAGRKREGIACYRCVMALDPNNFNADGIRARFAQEDPADSIGVAPGCPIGR